MLFDGYEYDVFISYVRGAESINYRRVREAIARKLELMARDNDLPSRRVSVFLDDTDLPSNGSVSEECRRAAASSAFLMSFVSDGYASSIYCAEEVEAFLGAVSERRRSALEAIWLLKLETEARLPAPVAPRLASVKWEELYDADGPIHDSLDDNGKATRNPRFDRIVERICDTLWERARAAKLLPASDVAALVQPNAITTSVRPGVPAPAPAKRVVIGVGDRRTPEQGAIRAELVAELTRRGGLDVGAVNDRLFEEADDLAQALRSDLAGASLLVLVTSGQEGSLTELKLQRGALAAGTPCLLLHAGDSQPPLLPRSTDPEPLVGQETAAAALKIRTLIGLGGEGPTRRPWIVAAANERAEKRYVELLEQRMNQIWVQRERPGNPPKIIALTYGELAGLAQGGRNYHGFVAILASMLPTSMIQYMEDILQFAELNELDKETAVAVFPPLPAMVHLPFEIINCNPEINDGDLANHLDLVWKRWQAQRGTAQ
jgi:hypothetical protein